MCFKYAKACVHVSFPSVSSEFRRYRIGSSGVERATADRQVIGANPVRSCLFYLAWTLLPCAVATHTLKRILFAALSAIEFRAIKAQL